MPLINEPMESMLWIDLVLNNACYPQHKKMALGLITNYIGYSVDEKIVAPHIAFVQALIENKNNKGISKSDFTKEMMFHCKRIRNDDMKEGGWIDIACYSDEHYEHYNTHLAFYRQQARDRLSEYLGYKPELNYSLGAEMHLRSLLECDDYHENLPFNEVDCKAATVVRYREAFLLEGEVVADDSELLGYRMAWLKAKKKLGY